jgi:GR25 family glycosyltransferase involved in LPS biosynthesis
MNKLEGFPTINCISLEESIARRELLSSQFSEYDLTPNYLLSKRYTECKDTVFGVSLHSVDEKVIACAVSHLKMIKKWYDTTDEEYGFFCEDDLSLETIPYWSFTFHNFMQQLPPDWEAVQLCVIRDSFVNVLPETAHISSLRERHLDDWSVTAYILTRNYAKKLIDQYIFQLKDILYNLPPCCGEATAYKLEVNNWPLVQPLAEHIILLNTGKVYCCPLFIENISGPTTSSNEQSPNHIYSSNFIMDWWKKINKLKDLPTIHYISLEKSTDRRNNLENWFKKYNITNYVPHLFKRFEEYDYNLVGPYVDHLAPHSKGPITSHFTLLKELYETHNDEYFLIIEDDLSLETVQYWNFTWEEFFNNLPKDWNCIQLVLIREHLCNDYIFEKRKENDWCAAAYLIKREYIKLLLDLYYFDNFFNLDIENLELPPIIERLLFTNKPGVYCFPLFVEDCYNTYSSLHPEKAHTELIKGQGPMHHTSYDSVINWWKNKGNLLTIKDIRSTNIFHIYDQPQFGENWFTYPNLYKKAVREALPGSKFVEVGSWKGKSSAFMAVEIANSSKNIEFYCIDTWEGSTEHQDMGNLESLYATFIQNMMPLVDYYVPIKTTSLKASALFEDESLDFVFIDASHEYDDVRNDITAWLPKIKNNGIIAGHDYYTNSNHHPGVKKAVDEIFDTDELIFDESCWIYKKVKE